MAEDDSQPLGRRPATQTSPLNMVVICRVCEHAIWQAVVDHMRVCVCSIYILLEKAKQSFAISKLVIHFTFEDGYLKTKVKYSFRNLAITCIIMKTLFENKSGIRSSEYSFSAAIWR